MTIVTTHYRYKRPPRKRKAVAWPMGAAQGSMAEGMKEGRREMAGIIERLNADIAAYAAQPIEEPWRTDLHALFLDIVAGLEREEWTRDDLIELVDHAAVTVAQRTAARE